MTQNSLPHITVDSKLPVDLNVLSSGNTITIAMRYIAVVITALFSLQPWMSHAQKWVAGAHVGAAIGTGGNSQVVRTGPAISGNVAYRYNANVRFGLEGTLAWQGPNHDEATYRDARLNSFMLVATIDYVFADYGFQPFFGIGGGALFRSGRFTRDDVRIEQNDVVPVVVPYIGTRLMIGSQFETELRATFLSTLAAGTIGESDPFRGAFLGLQAGIAYKF